MLRPLAEHLVPGKTISKIDVSIWRFCYWVERRLMERIRAQRAGRKSADRFKQILDHAFEINSGVFFAGTVAERVESLYNTFGTYRKLTARCAVEIDTDIFGDTNASIPPALFENAFYACKPTELHAACFLEHKARLTLLKAAVDYLSYRADGESSKAGGSFRIKMGGKEFTIPTVSFPTRFNKAIDQLGDEPYFRRYPVFWQWFLGAFGGFVLKDYEDREHQMLAEKAGLPVDAVPDAFAAFDKLFPTDGGWFRESSNSNLRSLILYPPPMAGVGANYRRGVYAGDKKWNDLTLTGHLHAERSVEMEQHCGRTADRLTSTTPTSHDRICPLSATAPEVRCREHPRVF